MKTTLPPGYYHNGFVATHALGHMMYGYTLLLTILILVNCIKHSFQLMEQTMCKLNLFFNQGLFHSTNRKAAQVDLSFERYAILQDQIDDNALAK